MNFYERIYDLTKGDDQSQKAMQAFEQIFRLLKTWKYRMVSPAGILPGLLMPVLPKFVLDNKEDFNLPDDMAVGIENLMNRGYAYDSGMTIAIMNQFIGHLTEWIGIQNRMIASIYIAQEGDNLLSFLRESFLVLKDLDLNVHRHPFAAFEALLEIIEQITRYEGRKSGDLVSERSVSSLMAELADIQSGNTVYDGACGYGVLMGMAVAATGAVPYMQDVSNDCTAVASILMMFAGHSEAVIRCGDTMVEPLSKENDLYFDRFLTHPPYLNYSSEMEWRNTSYLEQDQFLYAGSVPTADRWGFIRNALARLKPDGVGVALVPVSVLSRDPDSYMVTRKHLVWDGHIDSIIELPTGAVGSINTKWSIVLFHKDIRRDAIFMLDLSRKNVYENFEKDGSVLVLRDGVIEEIVECVKKHIEIEGVSRVVNRDEIMQKYYRLSVGTYIVSTANQNAELADGTKLWEERTRLLREFNQMNQEFEQLLREYNGWLQQVENEEEGDCE